MHQWFLSYQVRAPLLIVVPPTIFLSPPCVMVFIWVYLSLQFSRSVMSDSLPPRELQHAKPPYPSPTPGVHPNPCPLSRWCQPSHSPSFPSPPALSVSQHQGLFQLVSSSHQVAKVLEFQLQHQSFWWIFRVDFLLGFTGLIPCSPRDPEESSSAPQFRLINSLALSFLYGPDFTSLHGYWKNHSFD